jgi:transcription elongation GreA/GreB family factor
MKEKVELHQHLCVLLRADLDAAIRLHKTTTASATHEEAKPENDKDTRALELSYVARGQAARVRDLETAVRETVNMPLRAFRADDPIALGALVTVMEDDAELAFMLAPHGGGHRVGDVQIVTPQSPMGRALLGKHVGDECEVTIAGKRRALTIEGVA